jgi:hypothetical protein
MLSCLATHPIIDLNKSEVVNNLQNILLDNRLFNGQICPLGSDKKYTIQGGNLISASVNTYGLSIDTKKTTAEDAWDDTSFSEHVVDDYNDELLDELIALEVEQNELILNILNEDLSDPLCDFQRVKNKLKKYDTNELAEEVLSFLDTSIKTINNFLKI